MSKEEATVATPCSGKAGSPHPNTKWTGPATETASGDRHASTGELPARHDDQMSARTATGRQANQTVGETAGAARGAASKATRKT
jgi:hypothetical protein